jgi:hypothetical protein
MYVGCLPRKKNREEKEKYPFLRWVYHDVRIMSLQELGNILSSIVQGYCILLIHFVVSSRKIVLNIQSSWISNK